jgi:hypothetical protein
MEMDFCVVFCACVHELKAGIAYGHVNSVLERSVSV